MPKILIIMGNYSPNPSSVAICAQPLIDKMVSRGFDVDVVTDRKLIETAENKTINDINIYRVDDYFNININVLNRLNKVKTTKTLKKLSQFLIFALKGFYHIRFRNVFNKEKQTAGWLEKTVLSKCLELHNKNNYDAVLSISHPFKAHYVANSFIQNIPKPIRWFMFEFDPFSYNEHINKSARKRKKLFEDEFNMFQKCDKVFLTPELYDFYKKTPFNKFLDKFISVPFANMQPIEYGKIEKGIKFNPQKVNCIFAGRLYNDIRNPNYALKLFSKLEDKIHFSMLTDYNREEIFRNFAASHDKISLYPLQSPEIAIDALMNSDILVNIGNTVEFQIPGKIFEYMSTGKPIVHFSKLPEDPALKYLQKYPRVLIIKEWEGNDEQMVNHLEVFCNKYKGATLSYEEVSTALSGLDSESVSNNFVDTFTNLLKDKQ